MRQPRQVFRRAPQKCNPSPAPATRLNQIYLHFHRSRERLEPVWKPYGRMAPGPDSLLYPLARGPNRTFVFDGNQKHEKARSNGNFMPVERRPEPHLRAEQEADRRMPQTKERNLRFFSETEAEESISIGTVENMRAGHSDRRNVLTRILARVRWDRWRRNPPACGNVRGEGAE